MTILPRKATTCVALAALALLASCSDNAASPAAASPTAIAVAAGDAQAGSAGVALSVSPTFVVKDASGHPVANVPFTVAVVAGGGTITGAPEKTSAGPTSIGTWTLGPQRGTNSVVVTVTGLPSLTITATAGAGAPAKIVAATPVSFAGRVGDVVTPTPSARVLDAYGNPVASTRISVSLAGGGTAPTTLTTDAQGGISIPEWKLATLAGQNVLTLTAGSATASFVANVAPGDPTQLLVSSGDKQSVKAGATANAITVRVADQYGNAIANQTATFAVTSGGGSIAATTAASGSDGSIIVPTWTVGRSALPQTVHVTSGSFAADISATIQSDYSIEVRFFGPAMTDAQKALFTNAAARISGVITGGLPDAALTNLNLASACGISGLPVMNETVHNLIVYASVASIDGVGNVLAESGPCVLRNSVSGGLTAVGVMLFDSADIASMETKGITQDVITHEMLHVVGIGTLWQSKALITAAGTSNVAYYGAGAKQGCAVDGGTTTCASSVPVENNGVIGTADSHWRESTFGSELMTGYANVGGMPFSAITVGGLGDLGYVVNPLAADPYRIPNSTIGASATITSTGRAQVWEAPLPGGVVLPATAGGKPTLVRRN